VLYANGVQLDDYVRYLQLVVTKPDLTSNDLASLKSVLDHMKEDPSHVATAAMWQCEIGVRTRNAAMLDECTNVLGGKAPKSAQTTMYKWARAVVAQDWAGARQSLADGKDTLAGETWQRLQKLTDDGEARASRQRALIGLSVVLGVAALASLGWLLRGWRRDRPAVPPATPPSTPPMGGEAAASGS
jgi:hypothetical protein